MNEENKSNIFFELAKAKTNNSKSLKIETVGKTPLIEDDAEGQLTVDVYQDKDDIVVQSTIAGIKSIDDLDINVTNESITIRGKREKEERVEEKDYFYQECFWGSFSRSIILPQEVDPERSAATLKNGVLTVRMPKLDRGKGKKLRVKVD